MATLVLLLTSIVENAIDVVAHRFGEDCFYPPRLLNNLISRFIFIQLGHRY